ncbi:MAG: methyl-accepting chemotaxis protein [Neptuniibacter sp.]
MKKTIGLKLGGCFLLTLMVLLISSFYALSGVTDIRKALEDIAGEAWLTSDSASSLSLNVIQSTGLLRNSLSYQERIPDPELKQVEQYVHGAFLSLENLNSSSYQVGTQKLSKLVNQLSELKSRVIAEHTDYVTAIENSRVGVNQFNKFMKRLGFYSNYQISSLEDAFQRNQVNSWSGDVEDKWNFVIAIYRSRIALGHTVTALQLQLQSSQPGTQKENVSMAMSDLKSNLDDITQSRLAKNIINSGDWKGKKYSEAAKSLFEQHNQLTVNVQEKQEAFLRTRDQLLTLVNTLEKETGELKSNIDQDVKGQALTAVEMANFLNSTMIASFPIGVLLTLLAIWLSFRMVIYPVKNASFQMAEIASGEGDLSVRLPAKGDDEISELAQNFNSFIARIGETVGVVSKSSCNLVDTSETLKNNARATLSSVEMQTHECEQAVTAMAEISETVNDIASNASQAAHCSEEVQNRATVGRELVENNRKATELLSEEILSATEVISNLAEESNKVGSIITVIQGIAEQTNLLALNAAIEAARAGDHGRGFAVVADEVRALSHSTQSATEEIKGLLDTLQHKASEAVNVMQGGRSLAGRNVDLSEEVHDLIEKMSLEIDRINQLNLLIATATEEQAQVTGLTKDNLERIGNAASETAEAARSNSLVSTQLEDQAAEMQTMLSQFRV